MTPGYLVAQLPDTDALALAFIPAQVREPLEPPDEDDE